MGMGEPSLKSRNRKSMIILKSYNENSMKRRAIAFCALVAFLFNTVALPTRYAYAQENLGLPAPGVRVGLSPDFAPPVLKGIKVYPQNPFRFDFILSKGDSNASNEQLKNESVRLIKYFLASVTVPENDLWVNLSPYEKDRIVPNAFGLTEMGRDLLAEDYLLKQITASIIYPEDEIGKKFWKKVYAKAYERYGTTDVPVDTFNKVWIMPDKAVVYENAESGTAYVVKSHLKVMLESDYLALEKNADRVGSKSSEAKNNETQDMAKEIVREIVIPELERDVNEGKNFAKLRQVYQSLILATWFKKKITGSVLSKVYVDKKKVAGVNVDNPEIAKEIWTQYVRAFKKGAYNYIKEEVDPNTQEVIPRKYFSGGVVMQFGADADHAMSIVADRAMVDNAQNDNDVLVKANIAPSDHAETNQGVAKDASTPPIQRKISDEDRSKIKGLLGNPRGLITTENVDLVDQELFRQAKEQGVSYLRVTLRDQMDLSRLINKVVVTPDGEVTTQEGALINLIKSGGILLIDYNGSDVKLVEGWFNSLFYREPYFKKFKASPNLKVIGVVTDGRLEDYPGTFHSRFNQTIAVAADKDDSVPIPQWTGKEFPGVVLDLNESPQVREELIGKFYLDSTGKVRIKPGILLNAIAANQPVLIRGADWHDANLQYLVRQVLMRGEIDFNGETRAVPTDFKMFYQNGQFGDAIQNKEIVSAQEKRLQGDVWVLNKENQDILLSIAEVADGHLTQQPGLLERDQLILRITDDLPDWVWHKIMHAQGHIEVQVIPGIRVPSVYQPFVSVGLKNTTAEQGSKKWEEVGQAKAVLIESDDLDAVRELIQQREGREVRVYPATPETSFSDQVSSINIYSNEGVRNFSAQRKDIMTALMQGETVILEGGEFNPGLMKEWETALAEDGYILENGHRVSLKDLPGKLYVVTRPTNDIKVYAENLVRLSVSDEQLAQMLSREFGDKFKQEDFQNIIKVRKILSSIPGSSKGLYPSRVNMNLARLRLLFKYDNWLDAFENVVISSYVEQPEIASFMRVVVRLTFDQDRPGRKQRSIDKRALDLVLNKLIPPIEWNDFIWEVADTLSLDLLKSLNLSLKFDQRG